MDRRVIMPFCISLLFVLLCSSVLGQSHPGHAVLTETAAVSHADGNAKVAVTAPRSLLTAIHAIRSEYGWVVDYEDPIYIPADLVDATDPAWRSANPSAKGATAPAGSAFTTSFDEHSASELLTAAGETRVLNKVIDDYNSSDQPGRFQLKNTDGRLRVVGIASKAASTDQPPLSILDTKITLPVQTRTADQAVKDILAALSAATHINTVEVLVPINVMQGSTSIGGSDVEARVLLEEVITAVNRKLYWELIYYPDTSTYMFNLYPKTMAYYDVRHRRIEVVDDKPAEQ